MTTPDIHSGSHLNDLAACQDTALRQATQINRQSERIRELIAERDSARDRAELATLAAAEYAERAGVATAEQEALLDHERRLLTQYDRRNQALERSWAGVVALRWEMVQGVTRQGWHPTPEELERVLEELRLLADGVGLLSRRPGPREVKRVKRVFDTPG